MSRFLDLGRARAAAGCRHAGRFLTTLAAWAPVWVPAIFLGQIVLSGALPARAERARLERAEAEVHARVRALEEDGVGLAREARMLSDEVYRERVRRSLLDPASEPLTLERTRTGQR